jgi:MFS family permease
VAVNAFVGGMVGLERSVLPLLAKEEFGASATAAISFVATFGLAKALANLFAGALRAARPTASADRRLAVRSAGAANLDVCAVVGLGDRRNVLLGLNQGLAWSMTVNMKLDLAGPERRGTALGMNEAAGYLMVAVAAYLSGAIAGRYGLRPSRSTWASASPRRASL